MIYWACSTTHSSTTCLTPNYVHFLWSLVSHSCWALCCKVSKSIDSTNALNCFWYLTMKNCLVVGQVSNTYTHVCMYVLVHIYMHTIHTYIHTCMHAYIHTHTHTCLRTYTHTHTCLPTYVHTYIHTHTHTYVPTYLHTYTHTRAHFVLLCHSVEHI
jgi:hypothetical protein